MTPIEHDIILIVVGGGVLAFALRTGFMGGGGPGAYKEKNPVGYWIGVTIMAVAVIFGTVSFILDLFGLMRS